MSIDVNVCSADGSPDNLVVEIDTGGGSDVLRDRFAVDALITKLYGARDRAWPNSAPAERKRARGDPSRALLAPRGMGI